MKTRILLLTVMGLFIVTALLWGQSTDKFNDGYLTIYKAQAPASASTFPLSCSTTSTSTTITTSSTASLSVGMSVTGTGIPANSTISTIPDGTTFTISNAATATGTNSLTISFTLSCTTTITNATVTTASTALLSIGMSVTGTGIASNTAILSITDGTTFTITINATASGTNTLAFNSINVSAGTAIALEEYSPTTAGQTSPNFSIALPTTGGTKVVSSGSATSAGAISRSENGRYVLVPGYNGSLSDLNTTFTTNGTIRKIDGTGSLTDGISANATQWLSANNNLRGATSDDGSNYWISGGTIGVQYINNTTTVTTICTSPANTRVINIFNGQLFFSTSSGTNGIYQIINAGNPKPTAVGTTTSTISAASTAPYGFSVSPDGLTIYAFSSANQISRFTYSGTYTPSTWTYSGGTWSSASTGFTLTAATGIAVDWSGYAFSTGTNGAKIFACNPTTLVSGNDNGTGAVTTTILYAISGTGNNAFRGLAFSPIKQTVSKGTSTPATGNLTPSTVDAPLFQFNISADEGNSTLKKAIISTSGTATIATVPGGVDVSTFKLIDDANGNGVYDGGETLLSTGTVSGSTIIFSGISLSSYITQGLNKNFLVVGTVSAAATNGHTLTMSIASTNTINSNNYTSNITNAGGSLVTIGVLAPTGNTLTTLPVELTSFTAITKDRSVELAWKTATEVNNYGFEIERRLSTKDENWTKIGFVAGNGTTNAPQSYSYVDARATGTVSYRLKQIDRDGKFEYSSVVEATVAEAATFSLNPNYPNPFNPATNVTFGIEKTGLVTLRVYNVLGGEVATLVNTTMDAGSHSVAFDARNLPSGVYYARLQSGTQTATQRMMLMK